MTTKRIGQLLVEAGLVNEAQLARALAIQEEQGGKIVSVLISLGDITPKQFLQFLSEQPGIFSIDLGEYEIDSRLLALVPKEFALEHDVIAIDKAGDIMTVGMACPLDADTIAELEQLSGQQVRPLLCPAEDVRRAVFRYYPSAKRKPDADVDGVLGLEGPIRLSHVAQLVRRIDALPALPETVSRVREAMLNPRTSIPEVAAIILLDPPIAAKVLSVANSAAYGFPQQVDDLGLAVSLLGLRETYSLVLSCAILDLFSRSKNFDYRVFWLESLCCAAASRIVARGSSRRTLFGVFSGALLHDLGRAALARVAPEAYAGIDAYQPHSELIAAEEEVLGISHPEAGYALARHWELPTEIAESIRFHHKPELAVSAKENVAIVALAAAMVHATGTSYEDNPDLFTGYEDAMETLGLDLEVIEAMLEEYLDRRDTSFHDVLN